MPASTTIRCLVITPERNVLDETADAVVIPAHDGELGVWLNRAALSCELGVGQLRWHKGGRCERMFIDGGFARVCDNEVIVLTERALPAAAVTAAVLAEAERALAELGHPAAGSSAARQRAQRRLSVLRGLRTSG